MQKNKKKKGFTLVELIVVIVIIGVLAAVLVPSLTGYIKKAKRSNDVQIAGELSRRIQYYTIENEVNPEELTGTDIKTIAKINKFDLTPRTSDWTFIYNSQNQKVEVVNFEDINAEVGQVTVKLAGGSHTPKDPTNYVAGKYLIGKGKTDVEKAMDIICNLTVSSKYEEALGLLNDPAYAKFKAVIEAFNPDTTIYINNSTTISRGTGASSIKKAVYTEGTTCLPKLTNVSKEAIDFSNIKNYSSKMIRVAEVGSELKEAYPNINYVSDNFIQKINLDFIGLGDQVDGKAVTVQISLVLPELVAKAIDQTYTDELVSKTIIKDDINGTICVSVRKFVVSFYDETGVYARGTLIYSTTDTIVAPTSSTPAQK